MAEAGRSAGRVALVTGAAQGLGAAISARLAREGMKVLCVDHGAHVEEHAAKLRAAGYEVDARVCDLGDPEAATGCVDAVLAKHGRIDVLVNNAGTATLAPQVQDLTLENWRRVIDVNLTAPFLLARAAMPRMKEARWGRIVNMSSRSGRTAIAGSDVSYPASKAGLMGMTRQLALEGAKFGVTCNAICPGRFNTAMGAPPPDLDIAAAIPVGRIGQPEEIGGLVAYLVSEEAGFLTGAVIDINGGSFMA
jgi:3-oxoacyl-[acyl-carrier protein] reductase